MTKLHAFLAVLYNGVTVFRGFRGVYGGAFAFEVPQFILIRHQCRCSETYLSTNRCCVDSRFFRLLTGAGASDGAADQPPAGGGHLH